MHDGSFAVTPQYRKIGNHVYIKGHINTSIPSGGSKLIAVMPEGYRVPSGTHYDMCECGNQRIGRFYCNSSGNLAVEWVVTFGSSGQYTGAGWIQLDMDYLVD